MLRFAIPALAAAALLAAPSLAGAQTISGAGATFPYPIYAKWAEAYKAKTGIGMNYQSIGSGGGIRQIKSKTVDFGASDMPLKPEELAEGNLVQFPMIMGGVVPVVNIKGVGPGQVKLSGPVLADIYLKKITRWNDKAIAGLNPGLALPDKAITVVHRADGSGTTFIFVHYLAAISAEWREKVGVGTAVKWPVGVGAKGNEGVASYARQIDGAIGYVEYAYALQNKLAFVQLQNKAGRFVTPNDDSFQAAATNAAWDKAPGFHLLLTDQPGDGAWPITGASFILLHRKQEKPELAREMLKFFAWAYREGGKLAKELDYVPMPASVVGHVEAAWARDIAGPDGKPVYPASR